jgi:hypothetical protein
MFDRPYHARVAIILQLLNAELLHETRCYFGGGTAIALRYNEFRESRDIDLLVSDRRGYSMIRELVHRDGITALTHVPVETVRRVTTDQYGIRTFVAVQGMPIKFEIVAEGRIDLQQPDAADAICGVPTLTSLDMAATKLLANSDRWADPGVFSRDLIDLAMLEPDQTLLTEAIAKAETAYRSAVVQDLSRAAEHLLDTPNRLATCLRKLRVNVPEPVVRERIIRLTAPTEGRTR